MAGLGETCMHIAALLFYLEAAARIQGKRTSTQRKCKRIIPSFLKNVEYLPIKDIDFTSANGKKRKLDERMASTVPSTEKTVACQPAKFTPSSDEFDAFYESLSHSGIKPAILSLIPKYSSSYVLKRLLPTFPQPLQLLHLPEYTDLEYHELLKLC